MPLIRRGPESVSSETEQPPRDLRAALLNGSQEQRWAAARALAETSSGIELMAEALVGERDPRVREAIFTGLARIATPESAAIAMEYLRSDEASLRTLALDSLLAMPKAAGSHLPALLTDPDSDVRLLACEILRQLPGAESVALICRLLDRETEINVCASAIEVLAEIGDATALPSLAMCAERFKSDSFLGFSIQVAVDRLSPRPA